MVVIKEKDWADLKSSLQDIKELIIQKKNDELADEWILWNWTTTRNWRSAAPALS